MLAPLNLFPSPQVQPALGRALSEEFVENLGMPGDLWLPLGDDRAYSWGINQNHGTLNGGVTTSGDGVGVLGQSWKFDGSSGGIVGSLGSLSPSTVSVVALCYCTAYTPWATVVKNWGSATSGQFHLGIDGSSDTLSCYLTQLGGATVKVIDTVFLPLQTWQLVGFVADGSTARLYRSINGVVSQVASAAYDGTLRTSFKPFGIGAKPNDAATGIATSANPGYWNGLIPFAAVWTTALSAAQVSALYSSLIYGTPRLFAPSVMERYYPASAGGLLLRRRRAAA